MKFSLKICALMLALLLAACSGPSPADTAQPTPPPTNVHEVVTFALYSGSGYASDPAQMQRIETLMNQLLIENNHPVQIDIQVIDWVKEAVVASNLQSGFPFREGIAAYDLFFETVGNETQLGRLASSGMIADMTDLLMQHQALYAVNPAASWREVMRDGRIYAFPTIVIGDSQGVWDSGVLIRSDIVHQLGASMPNSPEELLDLALLAKEQGLPYQLVCDDQTPPYAFHRTYEAWPFFVDANSLLMMTPEDEPISYPHSRVYENDVTLKTKFFESGVLRIPLTTEEYYEAENTWDFLAALKPITYTLDTPHNESLQVIQFAPERANFRMLSYSNMKIFMSAQTPHPDACMLLLEAIYTDQVIYDAFFYGIEDEDWKLHQDGSAEILKDTNNWLTHYALRRPYHGVTRRSIYSLPAREGTLIDMPTSFVYLPADQAVWQKVRGVYGYMASALPFTQTVMGVRRGSNSTPPDIAIPAVLDALDRAGYASVFEDAKAQYNAFIGQ